MNGLRLWQIAGWTMLHYFWVGAALGAVGLLARRQLRSAAASVRYLVALGSLMLLSGAPAAIAVVVMENLAPLPQSVPLSGEPAGLPEAMHSRNRGRRRRPWARHRLARPTLHPFRRLRRGPASDCSRRSIRP